jgi:hypothetical protein
MAPLARSILARLLARRGDRDAGPVLAEARADNRWAHSAYITGVLEIAAAEVGWLDGSLGDSTPAMGEALRQAEAEGYDVVAAELTAYLRRAGIPAPDPADPPGPWEPTLAGRAADAVAGWTRLGERYECAVVQATSADAAMRAEGLKTLDHLGAAAAIPAVG